VTSRSGASYIPLRRTNVLDQVSKIQEHQYSPGILLMIMVLFASDRSEFGLGKLRKCWLQVASDVILLYTRLYQKQPNPDILLKVRECQAKLASSVEVLIQSMGSDMRWDSPKRHASLHFPDMIEMLGRIRIFDTAEGESALASLKSTYQKISNRDIKSYLRPLLLKEEENDILGCLSENKSAKVESMNADSCGKLKGWVDQQVVLKASHMYMQSAKEFVEYSTGDLTVLASCGENEKKICNNASLRAICGGTPISTTNFLVL